MRALVSLDDVSYSQRSGIEDGDGERERRRTGVQKRYFEARSAIGS